MKYRIAINGWAFGRAYDTRAEAEEVLTAQRTHYGPDAVVIEHVGTLPDGQHYRPNATQRMYFRWV